MSTDLAEIWDPNSSHRICNKKFTEVLSYVVCTQLRRHVHKQITKRRCGEEKPGRFVLGKPVLFALGPGFTTPYSLGILVWNFVPHIDHCVYWVLAVIWDPNSSHRICNKFFIHHCQAEKEGSFVFETVLIFFLSEYSSVWPKICCVLSQIQSRFLRKISGKIYYGRIFQKFWWKPRLSTTETCEILPYFLQFYSGTVLRWKNSKKYFHMLFADS